MPHHHENNPWTHAQGYLQNLMHVPDFQEYKEMSTSEDIAVIFLWIVLATTVYFVFNKTLRGFFKRTEKQVA